MTYQETLDFMMSHLPMYQRLGKVAMKKDLTNIRALCKHLKAPQKAYLSVHIAGTNGKGTVSHLLSAIFQAAGYKVGLYTSPHYVDFRERIKVNGQLIDEAQVIRFIEENMEIIRIVQPSFFEMTVAMAFDYFRNQTVDIAIVETGLGGRLDSTNLINPIISVITNISLDHSHILGEDEYTIAHEKAGIIKPGTPVVIGRYQPSCDAVFIKAARENNSKISFASTLWHSDSQNNDVCYSRNHSEVNYCVFNQESSPFMKENVITALESTSAYSSLFPGLIRRQHIEEGLSNFRKMTNYVGRWQVLSEKPTVLADSAHNEVAIKNVVGALENMAFKKLHFVLGFVRDKKVAKILRLFPAHQAYYFTQASVPRALNKDDLVELAQTVGLKGQAYREVKVAINAARKEASPEDLIFVGGSSFVVADALN